MPTKRGFIGQMASHLGTIVNALAAAGAWALGGPLWGAIVFLAIAVVRMALEVQSLRSENFELHRLLSDAGSGETAGERYESGPESEVRPRLSSIAEASVSQSG